ncbi:hypothetical protein ACOTHW_03085 [Achromobacter xylosoxidans]
MKQSDLNHLRRLLGWVRCDIGQDPAGQQQTMIDIASKLGAVEIDADAKARLVDGYRRAEGVPVYVRDAVKALEKALAAAGRGPGAETARATAVTRTNAGFDPGAAAGREPMLDDVQIERGLAEIGVYVWGPRGEDWLAGVEYLARLLRTGDISPVAKPPQNHPDAAAWPVACRDTPAAPPTLRRDDAGGALECGHLPSTRGVQVEPASAGQAESCRPAINLQVMQEALRLMPSDEARRVAREAQARSGKVSPEQHVLAGAVEVIAKLRAENAPVGYVAAAALAAGIDDPEWRADFFRTAEGLLNYFHKAEPVAVYATPQASAAAFAKLQSAYVGACDRIGELLAEKQACADDVRNALEEATKLYFDPQDAERIRALKQPRAGNDGGHLGSGNGPETRTDIGFSGGHLDADTVVLPPLPEAIAWATVNPALAAAVDDLRRAAVLADREQRAALTDEQCIAIYDALNDFCGEVDPEEYVMPYLGWPPDNIKQKAIDVMRAALAATGAPEGEAC